MTPRDVLDIEQLDTVLDTDHGLVHAVDALSLTLARGETFALVGESGCGKSMTALSLLRLLPDNGRVAGGRITLGASGLAPCGAACLGRPGAAPGASGLAPSGAACLGRPGAAPGTDLAQLPEARMRDVRGRRISIIFQEPATSLNPVLPVGRQIVEVIERHTPLRGAAARERALHWLERVGLPEPERRVDSFPFQLSGGQKQRVMIAIALAGEPDVVIADEPTTALDVTIQKQILGLLAELQRSQGMAMLLITHDLGVVAEMAQRVALMYAGQIIEVADCAEFFARPLHPYARLLLEALPDAARRKTRLAAIGGTVPPLNQRFDRCRFSDRCPHVHDACVARPPALLQPWPGHQVRCVLYEAGRAEPGAVFAAAAGGSAVLDAAPETVATAQPASTVDAADRAAPAATAPLLQLRDYRVWFPIRQGLLRRTVGWVKAVDGISFDLAPGRTLALVGESGCGKTTTGKALVQLLRGVARIDGSARLEGAELAALEGDALRDARRHLQIIFQDPYSSLNPRLRVQEILEEGLLALRPDVAPGDRAPRVRALLDRVGLRADALTRYPHEFSGGQRQRLAIARALAVEPRLIVCDEPTSALDVSVQAQILNLLRELQAEFGIAYLFITHNFGVVEYLADDIAVMKDGRIVEQGDAAAVLTSPRETYTRALLAAVPRLAHARHS